MMFTANFWNVPFLIYIKKSTFIPNFKLVIFIVPKVCYILPNAFWAYVMIII